MIILGINSFFEHPSVAIISDGKLLFSIEEERLSKIKGGKRYTPYSIYTPFRSIYTGLKFLNIKIEDVDVITYSYDKWYHFRESLNALFGKRYSTFSDEMCAMESLLNIKKALYSEYEILQYMSDRISTEKLKKIPFVTYDHHLCHAASAFYCSGYNKSLVFVADGCGEGNGTTIYVGKNGKLKKIKEFKLPHSLGFLYTMITKHLGFNTFADEYKVMGLASYGNATYEKEFKKIINYNKNGEYKINKNALFQLENIFGPARTAKEQIEDKHKDIAKSLQNVLEHVLLNLLNYFQLKTGIKNLCMAGGVALNCVANGKISDQNIFENIFIQPAASDAGTSIGAAALYNAKVNPKNAQLSYENMYLGTSYSNDEILRCIEEAHISYKYLKDEELIRVVARLISEDKIGGIFRGRMEAGPRALGNRSVIASPISKNMLSRINNLKGREMFRPIAPIVKADTFTQYFEGERNEYMLFTCNVKNEAKKLIPAVTHIDNSSRVQIVTHKSNKFIYKLIDEFENISGVSVIINTSLNFKGQPIVENPIDAIGNFYTSGLKFIVIGNYLLEK